MPETIPLGVIRGPVDVNPAPKIQFRESADNISKHRALIESREFQRALQFAKLQYSRDLSNELMNVDVSAASAKAMSVGFKQLGMEEFCKVLLTLAEAPPRITAVADGNLDHRH